MAIWSTVKDLLNRFADTQTALRLPSLPLQDSNPNIGDAIEAMVDSKVSAGVAEAEDAAYTAGTPGDWDTAPTTLKEAVDRLAALAASESAAPIP